MAASNTRLTPELASELLRRPHPKQRRVARGTVAGYAEEMKRGRWRPNVPDPLLIDADGRLFNGAHRCAAVVASGVTVDVLIDYDADPSLFDVIDVGRRRAAFQFIVEPNATTRGAVARYSLWYRHRFNRPLIASSLAYFDLAEILAEADRLGETMTSVQSRARQIHEWTGISESVAMAVFTLALEDGIEPDVVASFVEGIIDPGDLDERDPRNQLAIKTRQSRWRERRRQMMDDWTILVRALNAHLYGELVDRISLSRFWPAIGEPNAEFTRRRKALASAEARNREADSALAATRKGAKTA